MGAERSAGKRIMAFAAFYFFPFGVSWLRREEGRVNFDNSMKLLKQKNGSKIPNNSLIN